MGAIADRLKISIDDIRSYLQVDDTSQDFIIQTLFDAAKATADNFCQNDFEDSEGTELPIPADITLWVLKRVARNFERRPEGLESVTEKDIGTVNWGDEEFADLWPHRENPGF